MTWGGVAATPAPMRAYLDFEKPVAELEAKVEELKAIAARDGSVSIGEEVSRLEAKAAKAERKAAKAAKRSKKAEAAKS